MNGNDFLPFGVTLELASGYVNFLKQKIDMFEISGGISNVNAIIRTDRIHKLIKYAYDLDFKEAYNLSFTELIKRKYRHGRCFCWWIQIIWTNGECNHKQKS